VCRQDQKHVILYTLHSANKVNILEHHSCAAEEMTESIPVTVTEQETVRCSDTAFNLSHVDILFPGRV
jgi:hypothetical protein